jgi:hypothetical protein
MGGAVNRLTALQQTVLPQGKDHIHLAILALHFSIHHFLPKGLAIAGECRVGGQQRECSQGICLCLVVNRLAVRARRNCLDETGFT